MKSLRRVGLKKGQDLATQHPSAQLPGVLRNINIPFREALKKDNNSLIRTTSNAHVSARSLRNHNRIPGRTNSFCDSLQDLRRRSPKRDLGARRTDKSNVPATMGRPRPQHSLKASENNPHLSRGFATYATSVMQTEGPGLLPKKNLWSQNHGENTPPNSSKVPSSLLGNFLVSKVMRKQHMLGLWCAGWTGS